MYCGSCGKRTNEDSVFCPNCGAPIVKKNISKGVVEDKVTNTSTTNIDTFSIIGKIFTVENIPALETKVWFRFIKVLQGIAIILVILTTALTAYLLFDAKSLNTATLICNDGTKWNAIDQDYTYKTEINTDDKCGLCNKRTGNNTYQKCTYNDSYQLRYNSYTVNKTYEKDNSIFAVFGWSSLVLFGGLILVKVATKVLVYILGGSNK